MNLIVVIALVSVFIISFVSADFEVKETGVVPLRRGDVGMIFYATVQNTCPTPYRVSINMVKCCENVTDEPQDCDTVRLVGGNMGELKINETRKLSYIYPNMYPYNREGECVVAIKYGVGKEEPKELTTTIYFNTIMDKTHAPPEVLKDYYNPNWLLPCDSFDEDPLDKCLPVDCHMKYSGKRNYYNHAKKKCEKVPTCNSDPGKEMPDIVYDPISNTCRNMEEGLSQQDVDYLMGPKIVTSQEANMAKEMLPYFKNMRCHHGQFDHETGYCVCNPGWTSGPIDPDQFDPTAGLYHMCTIRKVGSRAEMWKTKKSTSYFVILGLAILLMVILTTFCVLSVCRYMATHMSPSTENVDEDGVPYKRFDYNQESRVLSRDSQWLGTSVTSFVSRTSYSDQALPRELTQLPPAVTETISAPTLSQRSSSDSKYDRLTPKSQSNSVIQVNRAEEPTYRYLSYALHWKNVYGVNPRDEVRPRNHHPSTNTSLESSVPTQYDQQRNNRFNQINNETAVYSDTTEENDRYENSRYYNGPNRASPRKSSRVRFEGFGNINQKIIKEEMAKAIEKEKASVQLEKSSNPSRVVSMKEALGMSSSDDGLLSRVSSRNQSELDEEEKRRISILEEFLRPQCSKK